MNIFEFGIECDSSDEKKLVSNINKYLAQCGYRKMYKSKPTGISDPEAEYYFEYDVYYYQFIKQTPRWYFDLYPNIDINEMARFPNHLNVSWTLFMKKNFLEFYSEENHIAVDDFFRGLINAITFPSLLLHEYQSNENRI